MDKTQESLLRFAIEHSDPERVKELAAKAKDEGYLNDPELMKAIFGKSAVEQMRELLDAASGKDGQDDEARADALEELCDMAGSIDNANDLHKIKGLTPLLTLLEHPAAPVRANALWVLATCVQNNPYWQKVVVDEQLMPRFVALMRDDSQSAAVRAKALSAISGSVSNYPPALQALGGDGLDTVVTAFERRDQSLSRKLAHILNNLLNDDQSCQSVLLSLQTPTTAAAVVHALENAGDDLDLSEKLAQLLATVLRRSAAASAIDPQASTPVQSLLAAGLVAALQQARQRCAAHAEQERWSGVGKSLQQLEQNFARRRAAGAQPQ